MLRFKILLVLLIVNGLLSSVVLAGTTSTLQPIADSGDDSADWLNTGGTACDTADCYTEVDESSGSSCVNSDGDISYIESNTNGASQMFGIDESGIPNNSEITQIDISVCYKKGESQAANMFQTRRCIDGTCTNFGADIAPGGNYEETIQSHTGLSVTKTTSTDIEIGVAITGTKDNLARISQISAVIIYTAPESEPEPEPTSESVVELPGLGATRVVFSGQAYPGSKVDILRRSNMYEPYLNTPKETFIMEDNGVFNVTYRELLKDTYFFALRAEDKEGRKTAILSFDTPLSYGAQFTAKDIFFPPTIDFEKILVTKNEDVKIMGSAAPNNKIAIEIDDTKKEETQSDAAGYWNFALSAGELSFGEHYVKAMQIDGSGKTSNFSLLRTFKISPLVFPKADFNNDDAVNITDWSIFLFRWATGDKTLKSMVDLDNNGKVNIVDFSIFLKAMKI